MRVAIQATQIAPGGGLTHFNRTSHWLGALAPGVEFIVLAHEGQQQLFQPRPDNFHYRYYKMPSRNLISRVYWETHVLPKVIKTFGPDLLFVPGNQGMARIDCPKVSLIHNIAPFSTEYLKQETAFQRLRQTLLRHSTIGTIRSSQGVVFLSEHCREFFAPFVDRMTTRTAVVYHGRPEGPDAGNDQQVLTGLGIRGRYLFCASHIFRYKKIEEMVRAYLQALNQHDTLPPLYIAGTCYDTTYQAHIKRLVAATPHHHRVVFLGCVAEDQLPALYRNCDAFIFPSSLETCSVILIEAMAYGCAIACSDRSCLPEVTGHSALYFDPDDVDDFAHKIKMITRDQKLNSQLRRKLVRRAEDFSWERSTCRLLRFFDEVLGSVPESIDRGRSSVVADTVSETVNEEVI